jgi:Protein of unknown function (DUF3040)
VVHRLPKRLSPFSTGSYPDGDGRFGRRSASLHVECMVGTGWEGIVPLSEHEQRVLEQIERALYADDPKFAATVRGIDPRTLHRRRYLRAIVGGVVGIVLLPVGIAVQQLELSVAGFLLMLLAFLYGAATWRQTREAADTVVVPGAVRPPDLRQVRRGRGSKTVGRPAVKRGLVQRLEERWDRRRDGLGGGAEGTGGRSD